MRKPTKKQQAAAVDQAIETSYYRNCQNMQISVLDIGKVYAAGRAAVAAGQDLDAAIIATVNVLRETRTMKAIFTSAHGAHRIKATDHDGNTAIEDKDPACQMETHHDDAVRKLCNKMRWHGTLAKGFVLRAGVTVGRVYVWTTSGAHGADTITIDPQRSTEA